MKEKKRLARDNKGMSLVEVIIAITILSVVIVPVFQSLTTAMVYNAKARVRQNLTITAESIMETFKGYSLEDLKTMFTPDGSITGGIAGVNGGGYSYIAITNTVGESTVETGEYVFTISDFTQNNEQYSAEITVTPNGTQSVYEVRDISTTNNAVFTSSRDYDKNLINSMYNTYIGNSNGEVTGFYNLFGSIRDAKKNEYSSNTTYDFKYLKIYPGSSPSGIDLENEENLKIEDIKNYIVIHDRTTTYDITDNGQKATVTIEYHFTIENFPYTVVLEKKTNNGISSKASDDNIDLTPNLSFSGESGGEEKSETISRYPANENEYLTYKVTIAANEIYNNTNAKLERLYAYYYPLYEKEGSNLIKDIIKINNSSNIDFDFYLIKQLAADLSTAKIEIGESAYKPEIQLNGTGKVSLYHNLNINVATGKELTGKYTIPSNFVNYMTSGDYTASTEFEKTEMLSYAVKVQIIKGDSVVSSIESSMNEKINDTITTTTEASSETE